MTEEREIKNWIEERRKGSDLMCKLFNRNKELEEENEELKEQIDCYKAFESHYDEIEEDAKAIAEENEDLKKNALVWHDLRKDPNDLPEERGDYWIKYDSASEEKGGFYDVHYFDPNKLFYKKHWSEIGVMVWCELPKYEEGGNDN